MWARPWCVSRVSTLLFSTRPSANAEPGRSGARIHASRARRVPLRARARRDACRETPSDRPSLPSPPHALPTRGSPRAPNPRTGPRVRREKLHDAALKNRRSIFTLTIPKARGRARAPRDAPLQVRAGHRARRHAGRAGGHVRGDVRRARRAGLARGRAPAVVQGARELRRDADRPRRKLLRVDRAVHRAQGAGGARRDGGREVQRQPAGDR